jgi:FixJ family two-component response regulator
MPRIPLISIVDDDALRSSLENLIRSAGLRAQGFPSAEAFLRSDKVHETGCLILDMPMPGMSGLELQLSDDFRQLAHADHLYHRARRCRSSNAGS